VLRAEALDPGHLARPHAAEAEAAQPLAERGVGVRVQPVGRLDHVGVGVVDPAVGAYAMATSASNPSLLA